MATTLLFAALIVPPSWAQLTSAPAACRDLTPAQIAALATDAAQQQGIPISQYRISSIRFSFMHQEWRTFFLLNRFPYDDRLPVGLPICASVYFDAKAKVTNINTCPVID
jgi:hypothetical protein